MKKSKENIGKLRLKKGDIVKVISGESKGEQGKVLSISKEANRAVVEGVNLVSRHTKPDASNPDGGIIKKEAGVHMSNLMIVDPASGEATKIGRKLNESGKLQRFSKKTGEFIA
ncbi:MAG: large subunit ribosomal protein L24 [Sphingobacteriales bacterium]|jgi:large subunit ribosomal protein L24